MKKTKNVISKTGKCLLVFGILFSQLSFPLNVLAEEFLIDEQEVVKTEEKETINGLTDITDEETLEKVKTNNNETEFKQPLDTTETEEEKEETTPESLNFTIELTEDSCIIRNEFNKTLTIKDLKQKFEEIVQVLDSEGNELTDEETILTTGDQLVLENIDGIKTPYHLLILGDYNENGMIDDSDYETFINLLKMESNEDILSTKLPIIDLNRDNVFNILDVTYPIFTDNTWENEQIATDNLENYLMPSTDEVYLDEEIEVAYYIEGFQVDSLVGIQGKLNYNKDLLELTNVQVNGVEYSISEFETGKFLFLLDHYQQDGALITLTFKAKTVGNANIVIEDIIASLGGTAANLDSNKVSTSFDILEYGKGGDVDEENKNDNTQTIEPPKVEPTTPENTPKTSNAVPTVVTTVKPVTLSGDNYIKSLVIKGYDIEFDQNTETYSITVKNSVSSLELTVALSDENATYYVEGNKDFKVGENTVNIVVKAENGSTRTYSIKVNKEKAESTKKDTEEEEITENNTSKTIIIVLIILVIIGLIYVIFKDDEEDEKESKK